MLQTIIIDVKRQHSISSQDVPTFTPLVSSSALTDYVATCRENFLFYSADNYRNSVCCSEGLPKLQGISLLQPPNEVVVMTTVEFQEG
jgi:hypothetical protein